MRRVVITGVGCRTPIGDSYVEVKKSLYEGRRAGEFFDGVKWPVCRVKSDLDKDLTQFDMTITDRISRLAWSSYLDCKRDAGFSEVGGVFFGMGFFAATMESSMQDFYKSGRVRPNTIVQLCPNGPASFIALQEKITGPNFTYNTACSASSLAMGEAYGYIARGEVDSLIAGGVESPVGGYSVTAWAYLRAISTEKDDPSRGCSPFDKNRKGVMLAEGAAVYHLEALDCALARGAKIYAEVLGYGTSWGTETMTRPSLAGEISAMQKAISKAHGREITYINAHGTGTPMGDMVELQAIDQIFGATAKGIPVSSTKALHGHLLGASGAMETLSCLAVLETDDVVPNWNLSDPDPQTPSDVWLPTKTVRKAQDVCLNNSFAFGGTNVSLAFGKFRG